MTEDLKLSPAGERLIKHFESCLKPVGDGRYKSYYCPAGVLTIGWGHTNDHGRKFAPGAIWTREECDAAFREDMAHFIPRVKRLVKRELTQGQFDALVSFAYNCGEGALAKSSILRKLNAGDLEGAANAFALWNKGGGRVLAGLVRRRASEALMFRGIKDANFDGRPDRPQAPVEPQEEPVDPMPQKVDPPEPPKPAAKSKSIWTTIGVVATSLFSILGEAWEQTKYLVTDPTVLLVVTIIIEAGGVFLVHDRNKKLTEEYV
jgi:lysozyme